MLFPIKLTPKLAKLKKKRGKKKKKKKPTKNKTKQNPFLVHVFKPLSTKVLHVLLKKEKQTKAFHAFFVQAYVHQYSSVPPPPPPGFTHFT